MKHDPLPWPGHPSIGRNTRMPDHIALVGNFPPRRCGLATYTEDSYRALLAHPTAPRVDVYAMDDGQVDDYSDEVVMLIPDADIGGYLSAAEAIETSGAQVLWIQHEYGIFGGDAGSHLLALVNRTSLPLILTLHTILETPNDSQRMVLQKLIDRADSVIVMAEKGREILSRCWRVSDAKVHVIPHGIPDRPLVDPVAAREQLGLAQRPTILTFGLLSPDKGIADMIEAMPAICAHTPDTQYIVLGATHPHLRRREGEHYRESLIARVNELGLGDAVSFVDRFVELDELMIWLGAADVYVTPYLNPAQITSGTLSYAVGLGKPVVATPFVHATEILADDHGRLVPMHDPAALAAEVGRLLTDTADRLALGRRAWERGRTMIWPRNADAVLAAMSNERRVHRMSARLATPQPTIAPIERMSDSVGILQHSILNVPDRNHGYCIDDNARALMLMAIASDIAPSIRAALGTTYASFVQHAWNEDRGRYRNFMAYDRTWLEEVGSEDSNGRALWTLGMVARHGPGKPLSDWAQMWWDRTVDATVALSSTRTIAFTMLGAVEMTAVRPADDYLQSILRNGAAQLNDRLMASRRSDWAWFEPVLSYDNTRMCEAMVRAGQILGDADIVATGLETLEWLSRLTMGNDGMFMPVGTTGFNDQYAQPAVFDQQPLEAWAMIEACACAWDLSRDAVWIARAQSAHDWFLGRNVLSRSLVTTDTGECADGINPFDVNANNGAESIIAWAVAQRSHARLIAGLPHPHGRIKAPGETIAVAA